jgi:AcrR family transcriptional regulator
VRTIQPASSEPCLGRTTDVNGSGKTIEHHIHRRSNLREYRGDDLIIRHLIGSMNHSAFTKQSARRKPEWDRQARTELPPTSECRLHNDLGEDGYPVSVKREENREATRRAISTAAVSLALEHGSASVTAEEIAKAANVSRRTLFNHFGSREEAILGIDLGRASRYASRLEARPPEEAPLQALIEAILGARSIDFLDAGPQAWLTRTRLIRTDPSIKAAYVGTFVDLDNELTRVMSERLGMDQAVDHYPRLVVTLGLSAIRVASEQVIEHWGDELTDAQAVEALYHEVDKALKTMTVGFALPPKSRNASSTKATSRPRRSAGTSQK